MLWDLIRDFFVMHVFGGNTSQGTIYSAHLGYFNFIDLSTDEYVGEGNLFTSEPLVKMFQDENLKYYGGFGDWLSTTATIISITIIVVLCCLFVYKIIKLIGGLIR